MNMCKNIVHPHDIQSLQNDASIILCLLEMVFPLGFFYVMMHLVVHLVDKMAMCGLVHTRWLYPFDQFMKNLKGYIKNCVWLEGCMVEGYIKDEVLGFLLEYTTQFNVTKQWVWDENEDVKGVGCLHGFGWTRHLG